MKFKGGLKPFREAEDMHAAGWRLRITELAKWNQCKVCTIQPIDISLHVTVNLLWRYELNENTKADCHKARLLVHQSTRVKPKFILTVTNVWLFILYVSMWVKEKKIFRDADLLLKLGVSHKTYPLLHNDISYISRSYHDVTKSVVDTNKLLWKENAFKHSDSVSNLVNAKLCELITFASSRQRALSFWRQRLSVRRTE